MKRSRVAAWLVYGAFSTANTEVASAMASSPDLCWAQPYRGAAHKHRVFSMSSNDPTTRQARGAVSRAQAVGSLAWLSVVGSVIGGSAPAQALVKGSAPPADYRKAKKELKGTNVDDAMEIGEQKTTELFAAQEAGLFQTTPQGDRYRDIRVPSSGPELKDGDECFIRYRASRLGKRSRDGLSGEASTVFSFGYGEDEDKDGDAIPVTVGAKYLIPALASGLVGMRLGGKRRILVRPERGWLKNAACSGVLESTNINNLAGNFIVPGTKIAEVEDCLDLTLIPAPRTYAARRRMGRRFDESLIVEVEVVLKPDLKK